jgi:amino acid transporter
MADHTEPPETTSSGLPAEPPAAGAAAPPAGATTGEMRYSQDLSRSIGVLGNIFITLSGVTPASSVFIIIPVAIVAAGSGSFLSFVLAGIIGIFMAFCWAELGSAFPIAGGDYAMVWHSFKGRSSWLAGPVSFITFALYLDFIAFIPATIALGTGTYLSVVVNLNLKIVGAVVMLLCGAVAILNIKLNALVTGVFLAIELAALAVLTILGFVHATNLGALVHPQLTNGHGGLMSVGFGTVLATSAVAVFAYNGYANAVNFAEETKGSSRHIARAILISLVVTVLAELIPLAATIVGSPSLQKLTSAALPMNYFILATSNSTVNTIVSLGVVIAILNAVLAIVLSYGRILYSSARDRAWPGPINDWFTQIHPRFGSPWLTTAFVGVLGAVLCLTVSLDTLVQLTGASLVVDYFLIAVAAIAGRLTHATDHAPYKMPLWPLWPILAIVSLGYIFTQQTRLLLEVSLITVAIGFVYWLLVIRPQKDRAWNLRHANLDEDAAEVGR